MHPANVAARPPGGGNAIAVSTRESPPHASKIAAIAQIQAEAYAHRHAPIASVAPDSANTTPGVAVLMIFLESRIHQIFSVINAHAALLKKHHRHDCDDTTGDKVDDNGDGATGYNNDDNGDGRLSRRRQHSQLRGGSATRGGGGAFYTQQSNNEG